MKTYFNEFDDTCNDFGGILFGDADVFEYRFKKLSNESQKKYIDALLEEEILI